MAGGSLPLLNALGAKMDYLSQRQSVIAQNIANADTPNYRAKDLEKVDFGALIGNSDGIAQARTNKAHLSSGYGLSPAQMIDQKAPWEVAPNGNSVIMEEQLIAANKTLMDYSLVTSLYQKQTGLIRTALGR